jgi:hypothetical protein
MIVVESIMAVQLRTLVGTPAAQSVFPHMEPLLKLFTHEVEFNVKVAELYTDVSLVAFALVGTPAGGKIELLPSVQVAAASAPRVAVIVIVKVASGLAVC